MASSPAAEHEGSTFVIRGRDFSAVTRAMSAADSNPSQPAFCYSLGRGISAYLEATSVAEAQVAHPSHIPSSEYSSTSHL